MRAVATHSCGPQVRRRALRVLPAIAAIGLAACAGAQRVPDRSHGATEAAVHDSLEVTAHCVGGIRGEQVLSFGLPFPRGRLTDATRVRIVSAQGSDVAADAQELARWRHLTDSARDGTSIRSVLVTFRHDCGTAERATYRVHWSERRSAPGGHGVSPSNVASRWKPMPPPGSDEHPATDNYGVDRAAASVLEPQAWVTLPADWLLASELRGPARRISDIDLRTYLFGFGRSAVNDFPVDPSTGNGRDPGRRIIDWANDFEGWLFDRPYALWNLYAQSGELKWLRHAHRASQYYASWIAGDTDASGYPRGAFRKRPPTGSGGRGDPKYSHSGGLLAAYLLTGDARLLQTIRNIEAFTSRMSTRLPPVQQPSAFWTERHVAVALAGALHAFEATGDAAARNRVRQIVAGLRDDLRNPPAGYPADMRGVLLHTAQAHEGEGASGWLMSPWMSALLAEKIWQYYVLSDDRFALEFLSNYAQFVAEHALYQAKESERSEPAWYPAYLAGFDLDRNHASPRNDREHAYDVLGLLVRGRWARAQLGQSTTLIDERIPALRTLAMRNFSLHAGIVRGRAPQFRLAPLRKFNWWFGTTGDLEWFDVR
ncbi:MAG TPA: hypothetical protein PLP74_05985 [Quisquiliibacterium sp.]|nr:hypothetical protein [Quisquiliibacterium sp.]HPA89661.1 hypothetical protein [Quisquiliibacterium sp.]HQN11654.1 hypothetical protein [Quisquiliibacterium sp.]